MLKKCKKCNIVKPILEYYVKRRRLGNTTYEGNCKDCKNKNRYINLLICEFCGGEFKGSSKKQKYCSVKCSGEANKNQIKYNCDYCGKECSIKNSHYMNKKNHYCSSKCQHSHQSIITKGENSPLYNSIDIECDCCGKVFKRVPSEIKENNFCSLECMGKWREGKFCAENSPRWNNNLTQEERCSNRNITGYVDFIKGVYERDNYICQCCNNVGNGKNLNAHHLNGYNWDKENRTNVDNGITLCEDCHKEFHSMYGRGNNTVEQFKEFMENKISNNKSA